MSQLSHATVAGAGAPPPGAFARPLVRRRGRITGDTVMAVLSRLGAVSIIAMLVVLLAVLTYAAWPSIKTFGWSFLVTSQWRPNELTVPVHDARASDH